MSIVTTLMISSVFSILPSVAHAQENADMIENEGNVVENALEETVAVKTVTTNNISEFNITNGSISIENNIVTMNGESINTEGPIVAVSYTHLWEF